MSSLSLASQSSSAPRVAHTDAAVCEKRTRFREQVSELHFTSERSNHLFGSPLGPAWRDGRHFTLPRFVYFGPHTHEESLRLAFYAGEDSRDLRGSFALLDLVGRVAREKDLGQGLNLSFFPLLDFTDGKSVDIPERSVTTENWATSGRAEVELLRQDVLSRSYHGFVRVEAAAVDTLTVNLRGGSELSTPHTGVELVSSEDFLPLEVVWEADTLDASVTGGPLTLSADLPFHAFELVLKVPQHWSETFYREAVSLILRRFILRYRGLQAYGQNL